MHQNEFGQPVGAPLDGWTPPMLTPHEPLAGQYVQLEPLTDDHAAGLFAAFKDAPGSLWTYLPYGPPATAGDFRQWAATFEANEWQPYAVILEDMGVAGFVCHLRIAPVAGSIEVGAVTFSPHMQRTPVSTEVQYLLMRHAFNHGYRRYEWKCDDLNAPSRTTAERLGFTYEGTFRQATHYRDRNRDTAWYSITDKEWPTVSAAFELWLAPENFDDDGRQLQRLQDLRAS